MNPETVALVYVPDTGQGIHGGCRRGEHADRTGMVLIPVLKHFLSDVRPGDQRYLDRSAWTTCIVCGERIWPPAEATLGQTKTGAWVQIFPDGHIEAVETEQKGGERNPE